MNIDEIRECIKGLKGAINSIQIEVARLERIIGDTKVLTPPKGYEKAIKLSYLIKKEGGVVTKKRLHELARQVGYSKTQGLGGLYYKGKGGEEAWLIELPNEKVGITKKADEWVRKYQEWLEFEERSISKSEES